MQSFNPDFWDIQSPHIFFHSFTPEPGSANFAAFVYLVQVCRELKQNKDQDRTGRSLRRGLGKLFSSSSPSASSTTAQFFLACSVNQKFLRFYLFIYLFIKSFGTFSPTDKKKLIVLQNYCSLLKFFFFFFILMVITEINVNKIL